MIPIYAHTNTARLKVPQSCLPKVPPKVVGPIIYINADQLWVGYDINDEKWSIRVDRVKCNAGPLLASLNSKLILPSQFGNIGGFVRSPRTLGAGLWEI